MIFDKFTTYYNEFYEQLKAHYKPCLAREKAYQMAYKKCVSKYSEQYKKLCDYVKTKT